MSSSTGTGMSTYSLSQDNGTRIVASLLSHAKSPRKKEAESMAGRFAEVIFECQNAAANVLDFRPQEATKKNRENYFVPSRFFVSSWQRP